MKRNPTDNLGSPMEVDVANIERELASLWNSAGAASQGTAMRACSCNLIIFVQDKEKAGEFLPVAAKVSEWHPSRYIIAYVDPRLDAPDMHSWIHVQCSTPLSAGSQVCCETITVAAREKAKANLPNTLLPLLVPDLPVYLYWRSFRAVDKDLIEQLARFSQLLIVDSHRSGEDAEQRLQVLQLLVDRPAGITMRDLNWARITAWRDLIAQFFDSAATSRYLEEISEIAITRNLSAPGSIPTRTLLLTGWLASSLGWKRIAAERSGDQWLSRWMKDGKEIRVLFTGMPHRQGQVPGISSVTLRTRSSAEFSVFIDEGSDYMRTTSSVKGSRLFHSVPQELLDEDSLLIKELSQTGEDIVFRGSLAEAYNLERAFRRDGFPSP